MRRYIDAELLREQIELNLDIDWSETPETQKALLEVIDYQPIADVVPVIHAHWKEFEDYSGTVYPECSRCGLVWWLEEGTAEDNEMYYCPKCGAKMDEEV